MVSFKETHVGSSSQEAADQPAPKNNGTGAVHGAGKETAPCVDTDLALKGPIERRREPFVQPDVSIVIPTLNEAENLKLLLPRLPNWVHELIIIDGRSTDDTIETVLEHWPDAKIVMEKRRGKGVALRAGFEAATGDIIVMLDADCSMDPDEIHRYVGTLVSGADFVKGSRFASGAKTNDMTYFRMFGNWGLNQAVRLFHGGKFTDLCYGYMAFWTKHVPLLRSDSDGFEIETMLVIRALQSKLNIVEVASTEHERIHGNSNLNAISDGWRVLRTILGEWARPSNKRFIAAENADVIKAKKTEVAYE